MMTCADRLPFEPSPREVPLSVTLASAARLLRAAAACYRRASACPQLWTAAPALTWRWAGMPAGFPGDEE